MEDEKGEASEGHQSSQHLPSLPTFLHQPQARLGRTPTPAVPWAASNSIPGRAASPTCPSPASNSRLITGPGLPGDKSCQNTPLYFILQSRPVPRGCVRRLTHLTNLSHCCHPLPFPLPIHSFALSCGDCWLLVCAPTGGRLSPAFLGAEFWHTFWCVLQLDIVTKQQKKSPAEPRASRVFCLEVKEEEHSAKDRQCRLGCSSRE